LFEYKPRRTEQTDEVTQFILSFKAFDQDRDSADLQAAILQVHDAIEKFAERLDIEFGCRFIVPVPSHVAYQISASSRSLCFFIARMFPWLQYPEDLLFRRVSVVAAHQARAGQRPTSMDHFRSLGCSNVDLCGAGVILFDDIKTTGDTSQACIRRLKQDTNCGPVVRLFLGKTEEHALD
jgi:hypothetical protein